MPAVTGSAGLDFLIGFTVSLISSIMDAAGLNLLKLDHVRNSALAQHRRRHECGRPMWHAGLYLYVGSQLAGSTIALNFLKAQWVAPLGSLALIFNFIFAKIFVGTRITRKDVIGTIIVMISVVFIVVCGGMKLGADVEDSLTTAELKSLFSQLIFIVYFSVLNMVILILLSMGLCAYWAISLGDGSGQLRKARKGKMTKLLGSNWFTEFSGLAFEDSEEMETEARDLRFRKFAAMIMATSGGLIASQTLLLAKSGIKMVTSTFAGQNQFQDMFSFSLLFVLLLTAGLQVYCLNTALKLYDSVLVVPMFYGYYNAFGLMNSVVYLNQFYSYPWWVIVLILLGIGFLIVGVRMLCAPKSELDRSLSTRNLTSTEDNHDDDGEEGSGGVRAETEDSADGKDKSGSLEKAMDDSGIGGGVGMEGIRKSSMIPKAEIEKGIGPGGSVVTANMAHALMDHERFPENRMQRRSSLPHTVLKAFGLHGRHPSVDRGRSSIADERKRGPLPKIDTSFVSRGRSETRRSSASARIVSPGPRPMSPSEFRAQYTNSPLPLKPKHLQEGAPGLGGSRPSSPVRAPEDELGGRGRSPRWTIGVAKMDQVFDDLNPFKALRRSSVDFSSSGNAMPASPSQAYHGGHGRRDSFTGLPSAWDEPNRRMKHSMLFGEHGRSSSVGSRNSSRSSSPAPTNRMYSPIHTRRQSAHDVGSGIWATHAAMAYPGGLYHKENGGGSPREPQSYQNHYFTGTPPPISATAGGGAGHVSHSSFHIPVSQPHHHTHHRQPSHGHGHHGHGRQLSFTTKNDQGLAAALVASTTTGGGGGGGGGPLNMSTGTFGGDGSDGDEPTTPTSAGPYPSQMSLSVQQQLQQLQQRQHYPTSQLQHSMTTSSISTIGSILPSMSTSTSLAQLADGSMDPEPGGGMAGGNTGGTSRSSGGGKRGGSFPDSTSSTSLWMGMTPSQSMQAIELDLEDLDRELRVPVSLVTVRNDSD